MGIEKKIGFVLLPGGGMGKWIWTFLTPLLKYPAVCVDGRIDTNSVRDLKKITINDCVQYVIDQINASQLESIILAGHSGSGCLVELIAEKMKDRIQSLVFICANIPPRGKRTIDVLPFILKWMNLLSVHTMLWGLKPSPEQHEKMVRKNFCNCCSEEIIRFTLAHPIKMEPPAIVTEKIFRPDLQTIPKIFIKLSKDRTASLNFQNRMIENLGGAEQYTIESDHMVMLSKPKELAEILNGVC